MCFGVLVLVFYSIQSMCYIADVFAAKAAPETLKVLAIESIQACA
jgi:hypothetical protein